MGFVKTFFGSCWVWFQENKFVGKEKKKKKEKSKRVQLNPVGFWNCVSIEPKPPNEIMYSIAQFLL